MATRYADKLGRRARIKCPNRDFALLALFLQAFPKADAGSAAILVDELDAGQFQGAPDRHIV